jgi:hypothetical protein
MWFSSSSSQSTIFPLAMTHVLGRLIGLWFYKEQHKDELGLPKKKKVSHDKFSSINWMQTPSS